MRSWRVWGKASVLRSCTMRPTWVAWFDLCVPVGALAENHALTFPAEQALVGRPISRAYGTQSPRWNLSRCCAWNEPISRHDLIAMGKPGGGESQGRSGLEIENAFAAAMSIGGTYAVGSRNAREGPAVPLRLVLDCVLGTDTRASCAESPIVVLLERRCDIVCLRGPRVASAVGQVVRRTSGQYP
jgi:hypothetical protein